LIDDTFLTSSGLAGAGLAFSLRSGRAAESFAHATYAGATVIDALGAPGAHAPEEVGRDDLQCGLEASLKIDFFGRCPNCSDNAHEPHIVRYVLSNF
jgi:hypothetical protein